jgi:hypothetical protein
MRRFLREPIFHFLAVGSILFVLLTWWTVDLEEEAADDSTRIFVERDALLAFVQSRTKIVDESAALRAFEELEPEARQEWVDLYVREEVLVREARALGLDRKDELIRRRLAQKIEFLTLGLLESELQIDDSEMENLYLERSADYRIPTSLTFTHVFVREKSGARARAESLLVTLNQDRVSFRDAIGLGDRFLYNRNYVDRTIDEVRSHFGDELTSVLESANPDDSVWIGPYASPHGWHLILLTGRRESQIPPLSEIADLLREDGLREKREAALDKAIETIVSKYRVERRGDF